MSDFFNWYGRQGYVEYDQLERGEGVKRCAAELGIEPRYVRMLLKGEKKVVADKTLAKLMAALDEKSKNNN